MSTNFFLLRADDERRMAMRLEDRQRLQAIAVQELDLQAHQAHAATIQQSSNVAADQHSDAALKLQAERAEIDADDQAKIEAGESPSEKSLKRRAEILVELDTLNDALDAKCKANAKKLFALEKHISELRIACSERQQIEERLRQTCSPKLRRQIAVNSAMKSAVFREIQNTAGTMQNVQANVEICKLNSDSGRERIYQAQLTDGQETIADLRVELQRLEADGVRLMAEALAE